MPPCLEGDYLERPGLGDDDGKAFGKTLVYSLASPVTVCLCHPCVKVLRALPGCQEGNPEAEIELGTIESSMLRAYNAPDNRMAPS